MEAIAMKALSHRNIMRGIVPTFGDFADANPTALANATDGDLTTSTTAGTKAVGSATTIGYFDFDLGFVPTKPVLIIASHGLSSNASSILVSCHTSTNGSDFTLNSTSLGNLSATSEASLTTVCAVSTRYFRLKYASGAAQSSNAVKLYSVCGYQLGF